MSEAALERTSEAAATAAVDARPLRRRAAIWAATWAAIGLYFAWTLATSWPYAGHWSQLGLLLALCGVFFRAWELVHLARAGSRLARWRRLGVRVATIVAGVFVAGGLWQLLEQASMARFEAALAPLVAQVHASAASPCPAPGKYAPPPETASYLRSSGWRGVKLPGRVHWNAQRFVVALPGGSMDIDGSTIWYDSTARRWAKFHNDLRSDAFTALVATLQECPPLPP
ncbi:MAG: hypothetical protein JNJ89_13845 [Rubrivivax sp.]|nr:hypothetical protein [Rubrivivax sp.]